MDATRGPILFRCDGTPDAGWEPFYQCLSLAAAMQRRRRGTHFFSYLDPLGLAQVIHRANNDWVPAEQRVGDDRDLDATLAQIRRLNPSAVVVASPDVSADYLREIRKAGTLVVVFDSVAAGRLPADVVVNPFLAPGRKAYRHDSATQLLLGHRFALCRGVFRRQRTIRATEPPQPFRCMLAPGDNDLAGDAMVRLRHLLDIPLVAKVSVAVRTHHPQYDELKEVAKDDPRVEVVTEHKELMTRLVRTHFAVTSGDTWALELCCVGIPQLIISQTTHHAMSAKRMDEEGIATFLGGHDTVTFDELKVAVDGLLDDERERRGMTRCARNMIDGRGPDRIVNGMEILLHAPARLRPAVAEPVPQIRIAA
jgi:spore coat polysaccharide biosynthesis predicted glycosyltransferase SpsG